MCDPPGRRKVERRVKMKLKKFLAILLAVAIIFVIAAGCGSKEETPTDTPATDTPTDPPEEETPETPTEAPTEEPVEVPLPLVEETVSFEMMYPLEPFTMPYGLTGDDIYNFQYMEEATNVHFELNAVSFLQASETFNIMIASQEYGDFIKGFESYYMNGADDAVEQDIVIDLMPYINDELSAYKDALDQDKDLWMYTLSPEGKIVSANYLMPGGEPSTAGLMYRADWLTELGLSVPETYDEVYNFLCMARDEFGSKGVMLNDVGVDTEFALSGGYGALSYTSSNYTSHPFIQVDNVVEFSPVTDGYRSYLEMLAKWYAEGLIYSDYASVSFMDQMDVVAQGNIALWSSSYDAAGTVENNTEGAVQMRGMTQPTVNAEDKVHISKGVTKLIYGAAITTQCHDLETALKWVNFCYTEKGQLITGYGKEGETYNMVDGKPVLTDLVINNPDYVLIVAVNIYTTYGSPAVVDAARYSGGWSDLDTEVIECFNDPDRDWAYYIPAGYVKLNADVSSDFASIMNDIATYVMQYTAQVINGDIAIDDTWDKYVNKVNEMGLPKAVEYYQQAWDEYLAKSAFIPA